MIMQMESPVDILAKRLSGEHLDSDTVASAAAVLAERLRQLQSASPMFAAVSFSPDVDAVLADAAMAN